MVYRPRGMGENAPVVVDDASKIEGMTAFAAWKPAGPHDELRPLLYRIGQQKHARVFTKYEVRSISLVRSLIAMNTFQQTLKAMGLEDEDAINAIHAAVVASDTFDASATAPPEEEDEEPEPPPAPEPLPAHKVRISKAEYDEILDWSDDEDMTTPVRHSRSNPDTRVIQCSQPSGRRARPLTGP